MTLPVAYPSHRDRKAHHEAPALGRGDPTPRHTPDFGGNQVGHHAEIVLNARPLDDEAVEVVLRQENGRHQSHDDGRKSEGHDGFEEGETGLATPYQTRSTKAEPLKDGPEPLEGTPDRATWRMTTVESLTVTDQVYVSPRIDVEDVVVPTVRSA